MKYIEVLDRIIQKHKERAEYDETEAIHGSFASWLESVKNLASDEELDMEVNEFQETRIEDEEWQRFCWANGYDLTGHRFDPEEE